MLTLAELVDYYKKGFLYLRIDVHLRIGEREPEWIILSLAQLGLLAQGKLKFRRKAGKKFVTTDVATEQYLTVSVERAPCMRYQRAKWEKIKAKMREAHFSYRSESPWSNSYEDGRWSECPF